MVDNAMAPNIDASLEPSSLEVAGPGESVEATLTVQNKETKVDQYSVELVGLESNWYTLSLGSLSLFPRDKGKVSIQLHPPKATGVKAGDYPFSIKLTSKMEPGVSLAVASQLTVKAQPGVEARPTPPSPKVAAPPLEPPKPATAQAAKSTPEIVAPPSDAKAPSVSAAPSPKPPISAPPTKSSPAAAPTALPALRASLAPASLEVPAAGQTVEATLTVQNKGGIVDQYLIELKGLNATWYTLATSSASLFPGDQDQVVAKLHPPKDPGIKAGDYPFTIKLTSKADPGTATTIESRLTIRPQITYGFEVAPLRATARRKAQFRITLANAGNTDVRFALGAIDREEGCRFQFELAEPKVAARSKTQVRLMVQPQRGWIVGPPKNYDLTISAALSGLEAEPRTISAQLRHRPLLSSLRPIWRVLKWLTTVGIPLAALWFAINYVGGTDQAVELWAKLLESIIQQVQTILGRF